MIADWVDGLPFDLTLGPLQPDGGASQAAALKALSVSIQPLVDKAVMDKILADTPVIQDLKSSQKFFNKEEA